MKPKYLLLAAAVVVLIAAVVVRAHSSRPANKPVTYTGSYVALGDSVAAGVGLATDSDSSACNRTDESYPHLVAAALHYKLHSIACSGATILAGVTGTQNVNELLVTPQIEQLYALPKPKLITLTIGANDAHWTDIISKCYAGTCGTPADSAAAAASLQAVQTSLRDVLQQIQQQYGATSPRVIVTGYHQVFPTTVPTTCADLTGIDATELAWGRQLQTDINTSLKAAVEQSGSATFIPVDFGGHELCTSDPWVQGLSAAQPYHPTEAGQAAFAKQIIASVKAGK